MSRQTIKIAKLHGKAGSLYPIIRYILVIFGYSSRFLFLSGPTHSGILVIQ